MISPLNLQQTENVEVRCPLRPDCDVSTSPKNGPSPSWKQCDGGACCVGWQAKGMTLWSDLFGFKCWSMNQSVRCCLEKICTSHPCSNSQTLVSGPIPVSCISISTHHPTVVWVTAGPSGFSFFLGRNHNFPETTHPVTVIFRSCLVLSSDQELLAPKCAGCMCQVSLVAGTHAQYAFCARSCTLQ